MSDELEAIRARHEDTSGGWMHGYCDIENGEQAHGDRAALLAHVDRLSAELTEIKEAAAQVLEDLDNYGLFDGLPLAILIKEKS
jgi:hypothetical protein